MGGTRSRHEDMCCAYKILVRKDHVQDMDELLVQYC